MENDARVLAMDMEKPWLMLQGERDYQVPMEEFNNWIDEQLGMIQIFSLEFKPSEVLYRMDEVAYRDLLTGYKEETEEDQIQGDNE